MVIKAIKLVGFQRHKTLALELDPKITTIKGASDTGKSSILRALRWVCLNDFPGDDFVREGSEEAKVVVWVEAGKLSAKIRRTKGKRGGNTYHLSTSKQDGQEFKAFGQSVPETIQKVLQVSELNFQAQHDSPFWLSLSAPEVSRQLNAVIDLSIIDTSLSNVAAIVRTTKERCELSKERLEKATHDLELLEPQRQRIKDFRRIELLDEKAQELKDSWKDLAQLLKLAEEKAEDAKRLKPPDFAPVEALHSELERVEEELKELEEIVDDYETAHRAVLEKEGLWLALKVEMEETFGGRCPTCGQTIKA